MVVGHAEAPEEEEGEEEDGDGESGEKKDNDEDSGEELPSPLKLKIPGLSHKKMATPKASSKKTENYCWC